MLLDELMPQYDVVERHQTLVRAEPSAVYAAVREADLAGGPVTRPRFRIYWLIVRPGSGLIRRSMLRAIRRRAEQ